MPRSYSACGAWFALATSGCITAPNWEYGTTPEAKALDLPACGDGALIEDGEDGDSRIVVREGRGGYWFSFVDSEGSVIDPPSGPFKMGAPGRDGSKHAARMRGRMAESGKSIYGGIGFQLADPSGAYDASKYSGVTFWAKGPGKVRFEMPDVHTAPAGGVCSDCYNDFGVVLALEPEWRKYTLRFAWLQQRPNWGDPFAGLQTDRIYAMEWEFGGAGRDFDISIDDIAFVCEGGAQ
jgi:endoglucanase